ncbi:hypothetical protein PMAYCL1PPCAC_24834, partial [Pristionchus mayeri]
FALKSGFLKSKMMICYLMMSKCWDFRGILKYQNVKENLDVIFIVIGKMIAICGASKLPSNSDLSILIMQKMKLERYPLLT